MILLPLLQKTLTTEPCPFLGCVRANKWAAAKWRNLRGDALLAALSEKWLINTPFGDFHIYVYGPHIVQFRGGQWRQWWDDDCKLLCALVATFSSLQPDGVIILQEVDSELTEYYVAAPHYEEGKQLVEQALAQWKVDGRIAKNSPRAAMCTYCSVKRRCDAKDLEEGATKDWDPNWKIG